MKKFLVFLILTISFIYISETQIQYPYRAIRQIQYVHPDSLLIADQIQNSQPTRWTIQASAFYRPTNPRDTVKIVGVCTVPAKVINFTSSGYNFVLADTGYSGPWGHMFVRAPLSTGSPDTVFFQSMLNVEVGDIVEVVGWVDEFPVGSTNGISSSTQFVPLREPNFNIIGSANTPPKYKLNTSDFYEGIFPGGKIKFSTGEPYEGAYVELTNLTVAGRLNTANGTVNLVDDFGNMISTLDVSKWWTLRGHRDPTSTYDTTHWLMQTFSRVDTIRGFISSNSGSENARGYRICPIYRGDVIRGISRPTLTTVRRYPVIVTTDSTTKVEAIFKATPGGKPIASRQLLYSLNNNPFVTVNMTMVTGDTLYRGEIPIQPLGTFVKYFLKATDTEGNFTISASGAGGGAGNDTSKGFHFYKVTTGTLTIHDVQNTPYTNGRSPYTGAVTSVRGIVSADTSDLVLTARSGSGGTTAWYMQSGNSPSSGIWVTGIIDTLKRLRKGDSVAVTGTIQENFDVTRIGNVSAVQWFNTGNPVPAPVVRTTATFGANAGNGDLNAEPWEGMLVQFNNVTVTSIDPVFGNPWEYSVTDGTSDANILREGLNTFSNVPGDTIFPGVTVIRVGGRFSYIRGIVYYSFNRYKIVPRTNADFGIYTPPVGVRDDMSNIIPDNYFLSNNYPNPFNPKTVIEYAVPREELVTLKIYNVIGQEITTLRNEIQKPGIYSVTFDASKLSSGLYFYRLQAGKFSQIKKMVLVK